MNISLVLLIVRREDGVPYTEMLERMNPGNGILSFPCDGSTRIEKLRMLGIEQTGRLLLAQVMEKKQIRRVLTGAVMNLGLTTPGHGIALSVPLESIGGKSSLKQIMGIDAIGPEERSDAAVEGKRKGSMILAIIENGHTDEVMDAARSAGASGGTVVHAKGTAGEMAKKFFGVTMGQEKELILILTRPAQRAGIMRAIMDRAGVNSPAHTVLFSLPVEDVVGIRGFEEAETES